jgi:hypothetical protein
VVMNTVVVLADNDLRRAFVLKLQSLTAPLYAPLNYGPSSVVIRSDGTVGANGDAADPLNNNGAAAPSSSAGTSMVPVAGGAAGGVLLLLAGAAFLYRRAATDTAPPGAAGHRPKTAAAAHDTTGTSAHCNWWLAPCRAMERHLVTT